MSEATGITTDEVTSSASDGLRDAALASVVAGLVYGLLLQFVMGAMRAIGALFTFGDGSLVAGWITHMGLSLIFALVYATITWAEPLNEYVRRPTTGLFVGAGYGTILWFVNIGFLWPAWLNATTLAELPVPFFVVDPLFGHLVWGALLGVTYPLLRR